MNKVLTRGGLIQRQQQRLLLLVKPNTGNRFQSPQRVSTSVLSNLSAFGVRQVGYQYRSALVGGRCPGVVALDYYYSERVDLFS